MRSGPCCSVLRVGILTPFVHNISSQHNELRFEAWTKAQFCFNVGQCPSFVESDLVDPRYFSASNIKNRLESYFQMIEQKRARGDRAHGGQA